MITGGCTAKEKTSFSRTHKHMNMPVQKHISRMVKLVTKHTLTHLYTQTNMQSHVNKRLRFRIVVNTITTKCTKQHFCPLYKPYKAVGGYLKDSLRYLNVNCTSTIRIYLASPVLFEVLCFTLLHIPVNGSNINNCYI